MAEIAFPADARVTSLQLGPSFPGRITHRVPQTGDAVIIDRGTARFGGNVGISEVHSGTDAANAIETWLAQLEAEENFTEIPLESRATSFTATTASSVASGTIALAALPSGLKANGLVRSGNRLFRVTSLVAATRQITLWPGGIVEAGDAISPAASVRARLPGAATPPSANGFAGPWNLRFTEAV